MNTWYEADGTVCFTWGDMEFRMTSEEAQELFVCLGHTLQDMDPFQHAGTGDQPDV